ncbi:hypothetical protein [Parabacteroides sp. FAFU027]|uniref:hypothetical protein n=1 Tax=Parabacteroides sp. FAFU027 TaxID=2922715 RepID=UPI001FAF1699|nr:hypothetical protein [Parabacteroides sp. FAFU027]
MKKLIASLFVSAALMASGSAMAQCCHKNDTAKAATCCKKGDKKACCKKGEKKADSKTEKKAEQK